MTRSLHGGAGAVGARLWRPQSLSMVRRRAQPTVATIIRLTVTAVAAFAVAYPITGDEVLAPLTALLVVQVTLYHTFRRSPSGSPGPSASPGGALASRSPRR
jgi:hypothetical protein